MWQYRHTDELYHGFKYLDKIKTSKGWRYIYDRQSQLEKNRQTALANATRSKTSYMYFRNKTKHFKENKENKPNRLGERLLNYDKSGLRKSYRQAAKQEKAARKNLDRAYKEVRKANRKADRHQKLVNILDKIGKTKVTKASDKTASRVSKMIEKTKKQSAPNFIEKAIDSYKKKARDRANEKTIQKNLKEIHRTTESLKNDPDYQKLRSSYHRESFDRAINKVYDSSTTQRSLASSARASNARSRAYGEEYARRKIAENSTKMSNPNKKIERVPWYEDATNRLLRSADWEKQYKEAFDAALKNEVVNKIDTGKTYKQNNARKEVHDRNYNSDKDKDVQRSVDMLKEINQEWEDRERRKRRNKH